MTAACIIAFVCIKKDNMNDPGTSLASFFHAESLLAGYPGTTVYMRFPTCSNLMRDFLFKVIKANIL